MQKKKRILIIGGGFGGVYTAITLEKLLKKDPGVEVGLISKENYLVFQPMLPEGSQGASASWIRSRPSAVSAQRPIFTPAKSRRST